MTTKLSPEIDLDDSLDSPDTAALLAVSLGTLRRLRKCGQIQAFSLPSTNPQRFMWRYRVIDILTFQEEHRTLRRYYDPTAPEFPALVAARVLGITLDGLYRARTRRTLTDYRPETLRKYLLKVYRRQIFHGLKAEIRELKRELRRKNRQCECTICQVAAAKLVDPQTIQNSF